MTLRALTRASTLVAFAAGVVIATGGWMLVSSGPIPASITFTLAPGFANGIPDNTKGGTVIATAVVRMSDGSTNYHGVLSSAPQDGSGVWPSGNLSGLGVPLAKSLAHSDDGAHSTIITAH